MFEAWRKAGEVTKRFKRRAEYTHSQRQVALLQENRVVFQAAPKDLNMARILLGKWHSLESSKPTFWRTYVPVYLQALAHATMGTTTEFLAEGVLKGAKTLADNPVVSSTTFALRRPV